MGFKNLLKLPIEILLEIRLQRSDLLSLPHLDPEALVSFR